MYVSINTSHFDGLKEVKPILKIMKEAGFDAYDYTMSMGAVYTSIISADDYKEQAREIRRFADEIGIACNQSHAPFPTWRIGETEYNEKLFKQHVRALEITSILGGKLCVVHPCNDATPKENAEFYNRLLPHAKANGVKIALENMWNWEGNYATPAACWSAESFVAHLELLDKEWFVALLDIGHAEMMRHLGENAVNMVYALKDRLAGLHVHDNDRHYDLHALPFSRDMSFAEIFAALKEIGYQGDVTLEMLKYKNLPTDLYLSQARLAADVAKKLRSLLQE